MEMNTRPRTSTKLSQTNGMETDVNNVRNCHICRLSMRTVRTSRLTLVMRKDINPEGAMGKGGIEMMQVVAACMPA